MSRCTADEENSVQHVQEDLSDGSQDRESKETGKRRKDGLIDTLEDFLKGPDFEDLKKTKKQRQRLTQKQKPLAKRKGGPVDTLNDSLEESDFEGPQKTKKQKQRLTQMQEPVAKKRKGDLIDTLEALDGEDEESGLQYSMDDVLSYEDADVTALDIEDDVGAECIEEALMETEEVEMVIEDVGTSSNLVPSREEQ